MQVKMGGQVPAKPGFMRVLLPGKKNQVSCVRGKPVLQIAKLMTTNCDKIFAI